MAWGRLDPDAPFHPKFIQAGPLAFAMFCAGLCYSNKLLTDGFIPAKAVFTILPGMRASACLAQAVKLVEAGLWEVVDGGWRIHDFLKYHLTAAEQREHARINYERGVAGGRARSETATRIQGRFVTQQIHQRDAGGPAGDVSPASTSPQSQSHPQSQSQKNNRPRKPRADARYTPGFEAFWLKYPKRVGKDDAWKAWGDRSCEPAVGEILGGLERQWDYLHREDGKWIPNPATWLRAGRWKDEPPATNGLRLSPTTRAMIGAGQAWIERTSDDRQ